MDTQKQDNVNIEKVAKTGILALVEAPVQLIEQGIISPHDWEVLTDDLKKQILASHGINPDQYIAQFDQQHQSDLTASDLALAPVESMPVQANPESAPDFSLTQQAQVDITPDVKSQEALKIQSGVIKEFNDIKKEVEKAEQQLVISKEGLVNDANIEASNLPAEEQQRIATERAMAQNSGVPKLFGYQPTAQTASDSTTIADSGPVSEGRTWLAAILKKILLSLK